MLFIRTYFSRDDFIRTPPFRSNMRRLNHQILGDVYKKVVSSILIKSHQKK